MQGKSAQLEGGQELSKILQRDFDSGTLLQRIIDSVNSVAKNIGAVAVGKLPPPPRIDSIQVQGNQASSTSNVLTCPSEILHWTMAHTQEVSKGVKYFSEIDTNPNFPQPHVVDHGTSRSGFLSLPTFDNNGVTQTYYLRSYPQYPGSDAAKPTVFGGFNGATQIQMTGASKTTLLSSTGSGTASAAGTQGAQVLGTALTRSAPAPKRSTK
jgi:hypothetical protein